MKKFFTIFLLAAMLPVTGCEPLKKGYGLENPEQYSHAYIAIAYGGLKSYKIIAPGTVSIPLYANYSGVLSLEEDLKVELYANLELVSEYNEKNYSNYPAIPENCFTITDNLLTIPSGMSLSSTPAMVNFLTDEFSDDKEYLLPVQIRVMGTDSVTPAKDLGTLYIGIICLAEEIQIRTGSLPEYEISPEVNW